MNSGLQGVNDRGVTLGLRGLPCLARADQPLLEARE
jgi:hypothetical protein